MWLADRTALDSVEETSPMKRGLKLTVRESSARTALVEETSSMKRGLKPVRPWAALGFSTSKRLPR